MQQQTFGTWLRLKRKSLDLTREALADRVGCSPATIRKLEAEERRPSSQMAERLAEILEIPPHEKDHFLQFARDNQTSFDERIEVQPWHAHVVTRSVLPATVTSLVGRQKEIEDLHEYLRKPDTRLITLIGPPGIGKTRLSIEVAREAQNDFPDGVFFASLAPLDDAALIAPTIVQSLGYVERKGQPDSEMLKAGIGDKHLLLLLDNCEHLIEDIASLASDILSACPRLKIIATSRESLRVPGEWQYPVPALELPRVDALADTTSAMQNPAVALFSERARAVRPEFTVNTNNFQAIASICNQLDGLPLAIELIASRMRLMSPQALLERMSGQFILSADGMRAVSARQKTLNNAIGWSYDFLSAGEQKLFVYLSVFSGGFTLEAAESIFGGMEFDKTITEILTSLSDKSLLLRTINAQDEVRFNMLYTIQQFARERLQEIGNEGQVRDAHLNYFVRYAEMAEKEMRGPRQVEWIERIEAEHNNNRAALEWSVSSQKTESAFRLIKALGWSWEVRGHYNEARDWLDKICTLPDVYQYPVLYAQILNHVGRYFWTQGDVSFARASLEESRLIAYQLGEAGIQLLAETLNWLGLLVLFHDEDGKEQARSMFQQGLELYTKCGNPWGEALTSFHLGILVSELRQNDLARSLFEQSYETFQKLGDVFFLGRVSLFLGYLYFDLEDQDRSRYYFEEHLRFDSSLRFWNGYAEALRDLGKWHDKYGNLETAQGYFEQCRIICRGHGLTPLI